MLTAIAITTFPQIRTPMDERPVRQVWTGTVTEIKAPNRMTFVSTNNKLPIVIRIYGIDPKGMSKPVQADAKKLIKVTAVGKNCTLEILLTDKDATPVGRLLCQRPNSGNKVNLGPLLLSKGFGRWNATDAPGDALLKKIEARAKSQKLGIWKTSKR